MAAFDLHIHSEYSSDGEFSVAELVGKCLGAQLTLFSLTDHNSVRGVGEAARLACERGIGFVPGIEIDCNYRGTDLHLLGYGIDWRSADFARLEEEVAAKVDFVFCAVNMKKDEIKALEEAYAKAECPVVSNNSAHRFTPDVPMVVPEINADHIDIIPAQRKRLGTKRGFVAVKSNCSLQSYVPALHPLRKYGISDVLVCTYQAISGAGKTFETFPDILDNVIPYIGGEEEKSEQEPLKLWGHIEGDKIVSAESPRFTAQCLRVPVSDGHMGAVFVRFENKPSKGEILQAWKEFHGPAQDLELPSAPKQFLHYFEENDRPQPKLDRMLENGMAVSIGRLREDNQYDYKFVCLSHNTLRGAAGGAVLLAELLAAKGYFD